MNDRGKQYGDDMIAAEVCTLVFTEWLDYIVARPLFVPPWVLDVDWGLLLDDGGHGDLLGMVAVLVLDVVVRAPYEVQTLGHDNGCSSSVLKKTF